MKAYIFILSLLLSVIGYSQNGINYKALIKDSSGNALASTTIQIQFTIVEDITNVYTETHSSTTDVNGIIIVNIGEGTAISGDFNTINWSVRTHFLNVQIDTGNGLVDLGTTQFMSVPFAKYAETSAHANNVNGLEALDEGNGIGWRLVGSDPENFGNVGALAVDLSFQGFASNRGATGFFSFASGAATQATASYSVAFGEGSNATGEASFSSGRLTTASGDNSTAMGRSTNAEAFNSTAIGRYNNGGGNSSQWIDQDPLFEIGNGTSSSNRSNALTVLKNGQHTISSEGVGLFIPNSINGIHIEDSFSNSLNIINSGFRGIYIQGSQADGILISDAQEDGIQASGADCGGTFYGDNVGVYASGGPSLSNIPDLILGSSNSSGSSDDGIISTNPDRLGSDMFLRSYDAVVVQLDYDGNEDGNFRIRNSDQTVVFDVTESGNLNIDGRLQIGDETIEDTGTNRLEFNAHLVPSSDTQFLLGLSTNRWNAVYATNGVINTSDRREKENIKNLNYGLSEILQMKPISFNWKNKNNQDTKLGLIAQDLQSLIPEVVISHTWEKDKATETLTKKEANRLGVYYSDLIPVLIRAIQEQQKIIDSQNIKIQGVMSKLTALESINTRIKALEQQVKNAAQ